MIEFGRHNVFLCEVYEENWLEMVKGFAVGDDLNLSGYGEGFADQVLCRHKAGDRLRFVSNWQILVPSEDSPEKMRLSQNPSAWLDATLYTVEVQEDTGNSDWADTVIRQMDRLGQVFSDMPRSENDTLTMLGTYDEMWARVRRDPENPKAYVRTESRPPGNPWPVPSLLTIPELDEAIKSGSLTKCVQDYPGGGRNHYFYGTLLDNSQTLRVLYIINFYDVSGCYIYDIVDRDDYAHQINTRYEKSRGGGAAEWGERARAGEYSRDWEEREVEFWGRLATGVPEIVYPPPPPWVWPSATRKSKSDDDQK